MAGDRSRENERVHIEGLSPAHVAMLKSVADEAAQQAVNKTLTAMGLDPAKPFEAQADMLWVRATRERCEGAVGKAAITAIGLLVAGAFGSFWVGFKAALK